MSTNYDVIIVGGGMAGLTLALQLKQSNPEISISVLESRQQKAPKSAHKVGESTVELGTYYLRETLALKKYLDTYHLPKHGLRFYFPTKNNNDISQRVEYGAQNELFVPSHQIDRGIFENDLIAKVKNIGVDINQGIKVDEIEFRKKKHIVYFNQDSNPLTLTSSWLIDATGRSNLIKRKKNLNKPVEHNINAVWFRVKGEIDIENWSNNKEWKTKINSGLRRLGTVHFMGKGYWVWFIPLSSSNTSIGIVADPRFHKFNEYNTLNKAIDWLKKNEPLCANYLESKKDTVLDFRVLKKYSYSSSQFYSHDKWALTGESGAFLDPFYSPGTDFIAIGNSFVADLILRDIEGEDIYTRTIIYDKVYAKLFNNWMPIYENQYQIFGNAQVMVVKITWDFGVYWSIPSLLFTNKGYTNITILKTIFTSKNSLAERFGQLNRNVQTFYLNWGEIQNEQFINEYIDPMTPYFIRNFQKGMETIFENDEDLINQLEKNLNILEKMAAEIFRAVGVSTKNIPKDLSINPYTFNLKLETNDIIDQGTSKQAIKPNNKIAKALSGLWLKKKTVN